MAGKPVLAHAERHFGIRLGGAGQGVGQFVVFVGGQVQHFAAFDVEGEHEHFEFVPGDFAFAHPKRLDFHFMLRAFIGVAAFLCLGTAHHKLAGGDRDHSNFTSVLLITSVYGFISAALGCLSIGHVDDRMFGGAHFGDR